MTRRVEKNAVNLMDKAVLYKNLIGRSSSNTEYAKNDFNGWVGGLLDRLKFASVLDLCCGTGKQLVLFAARPEVSKIVGIDISKEALIKAAVIAAARPLENESAKEIYSFEVLSSTEWSSPVRFSPDVFFDISQTIEAKLKAIKAYKSELRKYPHPCSAEEVELTAKNWGMKTGLYCAEAFKTVRAIR